MNCPSDGTTLLMSERQGIEIDYCPECRGIWLDRGELDKILERTQAEAEAAGASAQAAVPPVPQPQQYADPRYDDPRYDDRRYDDHGHHSGDRRHGDPRYGDPRYRRKKQGRFDFLGDIFG